MVNPQDLIDIAMQLADGLGDGSRGRPKQIGLSRAVSCAYYAMFHTLASCCGDTLIGATPNELSRVYLFRNLPDLRIQSHCLPP